MDTTKATKRSKDTKSLVGFVFFVLFVSFVVGSVSPTAHDIPDDVIVHAFLKPEGQRARLIVRVPYEGKRIQKFVYKGVGPVRAASQGVLWPGR